MTDGTVRVRRDGPVLSVELDRPRRRNAVTWAMYDGLVAACTRADDEAGIRAMVLSGAGDAFSAGTDITQFAEFGEGGVAGQRGIAYEGRVTDILDRLRGVHVPVVAAVRGVCVGAGLLLAAAADVRVATRSATFGVPVARTVGNCLSLDSCALLVDRLGEALVADMLLRARLLSAEEAQTAGFVGEVCADSDLDDTVATVVGQITAGAPLTHWASKQLLRRVRAVRSAADDDIVARVYASRDFRSAVRAFGTGQPPRWSGV